MGETQDLDRLRARRLAMLAQAEEMSGLGTWTWDVASDATTWSNATYDIHGFDRSASAPDLAGVLAVYHPDDAARLTRMVDAAVRTGADYALQARIVRPDGTERHVMARGAAERGPGGQVVGLFGTFMDVTSLKLADQEVRRSEALHRHLMENARDIIIRQTPEGVILEASVGCKALGYEPAELVGVKAGSLVHPEDLSVLQAARAANLSGGEGDSRIDREYRVRAKDGAYVWLQGSPSLVRDADGQVREIVSIFRDVHERRLSRDALAISEARYRLITEQVTDVVSCCDAKGILTFISPSAEALFGYRPEELLGRASVEVVHPDDQRTVRKSIIAYLAAGPGAPAPRVEYRAIRKDGRQIWIESCPIAVRDPQTGALTELQDCTRDVTARVEAEAALARSEERYRLLAENATDMILCYGADGLFTYLSPSVSTLGYRPDELLGRPTVTALHPDDRAGVMARFAAYVAAGPGADPIRHEYRAYRRDGGLVWLEALSKAVYDPVTGALIEFQDVVRDVTARKALEADLGAARDAAEVAAAVKSTFLANMSHEIRTPLTAILGYSDLLAAQAGLDGVGRQHLERIRAGSQALLSIVNDVLDFSKLEADQVEIAPQAVAIAKMTEEALALFAPQAQAKGLALVFRVDGLLPSHLLVDPHRVRQILFNLVGNAVKFTEAGSVRLTMAYAPDLERLHLSVADTGAGMDASQIARLFQRFSQVDAAATRKHGGTGLGLAICKGLAEAMGGGVRVESAPGQGSVFHVHLWAPVSDLAAPAEPASEAAPKGDLKVLVVDDNDVNRELARLLLESFGVQVSEARDGEQALAQTGAVDLILMDIRMPRLDGPSTLRRLRTQPGPNRDVPVLAFSADADLEGAPWAHEFDGLVRKPIVAAELLAEIGRCRAAAEG